MSIKAYGIILQVGDVLRDIEAVYAAHIRRTEKICIVIGNGRLVVHDYLYILSKGNDGICLYGEKVEAVC